MNMKVYSQNKTHLSKIQEKRHIQRIHKMHGTGVWRYKAHYNGTITTSIVNA